jgi:hypothetical protein
MIPGLPGRLRLWDRMTRETAIRMKATMTARYFLNNNAPHLQ